MSARPPSCNASNFCLRAQGSRPILGTMLAFATRLVFGLVSALAISGFKIQMGVRLLDGRLFFSFFNLGLMTLFLVGCATTGPGGARYDPDKPQIFLANAEIWQIKGLAMGAAVTKGWDITESTEDVLIQRRRLNTAATQPVAPGNVQGGLPALVEVRSQFFSRDGGVDVILDATVTQQRGTKKEKRDDFTDTYRNELAHSLASLENAWRESRYRVASSIPPLPTPGTSSLDDDALDDGDELAAEIPDVGGSSGPPVAAAAIAAPSAWGDSHVPSSYATNDGGAPVETRVAVTYPPGPRRTDVRGAPVEPREASTLPTPVTNPVGLPLPPSDPDNNMMALNKPQVTGVWAYYAEHYARVRGCQLAGEGAILIEKSQSYEKHRVFCEGGRTFLVKCNAGTCRGLE